MIYFVVIMKVDGWYWDSLSLQAEELIKQEMITMLHYDALHNPVDAKKPAVLSQAHHIAYLEQRPYQSFTPEDLAKVRMNFCW